MIRRKHILAALFTCLTGNSLAFAQTAPSSGPPPDLPIRAYQLPHTETRVLANGLQVIVAESHNVPLITVRLAVQAGSILDPKDQPGLARAVADQMTEGTDKYTSLQLKEAADRLGGSVEVSAGEDYATVSASALSENAVPLFDLMADVLLHPTFPEQELAIYRGLTLQGLTVQEQDPEFLASQEIARVLYGAHPYGVVATTPAAVQSLTRDKLLSFYKAHYLPGSSVLIVVGDVKAAQVFGALEKILSGWSGITAVPNALPAPPKRTTRTIYLVNRPGSVQSNIVLGNLAINRNDPDYFALTLANNILGGSSGSRLFADVREKQGYAYDVHSGLDARVLAGDFTESAQTRTAVTAAALQAMLKDTDQIRNTPVSEQELQAAKSFVNGTFVLSLTSQGGLADRLLAVAVYHLPLDYLQTFRDKISAVTVGDIQRVAQQYMTPDQEAIVVVGDANKLRDSLKGVASVEEVK